MELKTVSVRGLGFARAGVGNSSAAPASKMDGDSLMTGYQHLPSAISGRFSQFSGREIDDGRMLAG